LCALARRVGSLWERKLLDVACGRGDWLMAAAACGAVTAGLDLSPIALDACRQALPSADLKQGSAEELPFADGQFDVVSCLGALEHFLDPLRALREMKRVAKADAKFLLLVPNADFLPRRLGLYGGTEQTAAREEVLTLSQWRSLFESAGLEVEQRWRDLHVLSADWIFRGALHAWLLRAAQALALPLWPLSWQYQVYHLCRVRG
ncbi:MAG: class I SAM-dependent methyltransferase, partial [Deltaproteobacteria bacterium]|nr:class I SAM-dependent methyltransferase [Deltaproteobacteria bacterium]